MNETNTNILRSFRKALFKDVYSKCLMNLQKTLNGQIKDKKSLDIFSKLKNLDTKELLATEELGKEFIADTVHYLLWMIEQSDEFDLIAREGDKIVSLKEISDGLCGELSYVLGGYDEYLPIQDKPSD
jgi:hypothetical protein